jgi:hypothetical protein
VVGDDGARLALKMGGWMEMERERGVVRFVGILRHHSAAPGIVWAPESEMREETECCCCRAVVNRNSSSCAVSSSSARNALWPKLRR